MSSSPSSTRSSKASPQHANKIKVGPGLDADNAHGSARLAKSSSTASAATSSPASPKAQRPSIGGKRNGDKGYFVEPTVLVNTNDKMKVVQEEIFGPVVTAIPFKDANDLIAQANNTVYGLAAGIWTRDINNAHTVAAEMRAGTVWINCYNIFDAALPFGGYKQSGWGREMGHDALELYTEKKAVCARIG